MESTFSFKVGDLVLQRATHHAHWGGVDLGIGRVVEVGGTWMSAKVVWHSQKEGESPPPMWEHPDEIRKVPPLMALAMQVIPEKRDASATLKRALLEP